MPYIYLIISETEFLIYLLISLVFIQWNNHAYNSYIIFYKVFYFFFVFFSLTYMGSVNQVNLLFAWNLQYTHISLCIMYHLIFSWLFLSYKSSKITLIFLFIDSQFPLLFRIACVCVCVCVSEKAIAPHSSTLAWKIPWTEEPGRLQSMRSLRVRHNWATSLSLFTFMHWRRKWQRTPMFLPGESQGRGSLVGFHLWGRTESDTTEAT